MNKQQLFENIQKKKSFLCVGLDTDIKKIPEHLLKEEEDFLEQVAVADESDRKSKALYLRGLPPA